MSKERCDESDRYIGHAEPQFHRPHWFSSAIPPTPHAGPTALQEDMDLSSLMRSLLILAIMCLKFWSSMGWIPHPARLSAVAQEFQESFREAWHRNPYSFFMAGLVPPVNLVDANSQEERVGRYCKRFATVNRRRSASGGPYIGVLLPSTD